jgi:hypothetical protein
MFLQLPLMRGTASEEDEMDNLDAKTREQIGNSCHGYTVFETTDEDVRFARIQELAKLLSADACDGPELLADLELHPYADQA